MTAPQVEMRVLSWNVHGLRDDPAAVVRLVRDLDPDVFCVQEAPKYLRWRTKNADLARRCGLLYVAGGGTTGGSALYAHLRIDVRRAAEVCLTRRWGWPARGVAAAILRTRGAALVVGSFHLPLEREQRLVQAAQVRTVCSSLGPPHLLVAGDLNERPGDAAWQAFAEAGLRDVAPGSGPTFPATSPKKRIDGMLASEQVDVVTYEVVDRPEAVRGSDHRPLFATVRVPVGDSAQLF